MGPSSGLITVVVMTLVSDRCLTWFNRLLGTGKAIYMWIFVVKTLAVRDLSVVLGMILNWLHRVILCTASGR